MKRDFSLWVYLSTSPLLWLTVTLAAWVAADWLAQRSGRHPLVNPVLIAVTLVALLLKATGTDYTVYFDGAQFVHFLLGPATVALAVPLYRNRLLVRRTLVPIAAALAVGVRHRRCFGHGHCCLVWSAARGAGVPGAEIRHGGGGHGGLRKAGGEPALTAVLVIATGIIGAVMVTPLMNALRIRNYAARGFAVGLASHGIGTARAFSVHPVAGGVFAGLAMGLNAVVTAVVAPALVWFW